MTLTPYQYLLEQAGFDAALLRLAARKAGINRTTLYRWKAHSANALWSHVQEVRHHVLLLRAKQAQTTPD